MANKDDNRSTIEPSRSSSRLQRKFSIVKMEEQELDPIRNSSKKGTETSSASKRSSACLGGSPTLKTEDPHTLMQKRICKDLQGTVELWRGNDVGREAKELFETIEHCYPNTFQKVQIRVTPFWSGNLKELRAAIKRFMGSSVEEMVEEEITGLRHDIKDLENLGFDLSWAQERLNMVARLKFGNEPLQKEWMALEQSLGPMKERRDELMKQLKQVHEMYEQANSEYEAAKNAQKMKSQEMSQEFGPDFNRVLKDRLGFGMLRGYEVELIRYCD